MSADNITPEQATAIIHSSGCTDIQEAIQMIESNGYTVSDLDQATLDSVVGVIASAESVGAQAAPTK